MERHYLIMYKPPRTTFVDDATKQESAVIGRHFEYLRTLHEAGQLELAGRVDDGRVGIFVFKADSDDEAQSIMENDPAVSEGVFSGELLPFRLALMAGQG